MYVCVCLRVYVSAAVSAWYPALLFLLITHAGGYAGVGRAFSRVCLFVYLYVRALTGKRIELLTPNLVHRTRILYSSRSACIDPEVKRSKVKVTLLRKPSRAHGYYSDACWNGLYWRGYACRFDSMFSSLFYVASRFNTFIAIRKLLSE